MPRSYSDEDFDVIEREDMIISSSGEEQEEDHVEEEEEQVEEEEEQVEVGNEDLEVPQTVTASVVVKRSVSIYLILIWIVTLVGAVALAVALMQRNIVALQKEVEVLKVTCARSVHVDSRKDDVASVFGSMVNRMSSYTQYAQHYYDQLAEQIADRLHNAV